MMATAFLGYVLPYGQMSLWGGLHKINLTNLEMILLPIALKNYLKLLTIS